MSEDLEPRFEPGTSKRIRRPLIRRVVAVALIISATMVTACHAFPVPPLYAAKAIRATVVDATAGSPIEGAVVVAEWQLQTMSGEGPRLQVSEAVTDRDGRFVIPGWGPKFRQPLTHFGNKSPYLVIFKPGYVPVRLYNAPRSQFAALRARTDLPASEISYWIGIDGDPYDAIQESLWNGMAIRIERFQGTPEAWFRHIEFASHDVLWRDAKYAPTYFQALAAERDYFTRHPLDPQTVRSEVVNAVFNQIDILGGVHNEHGGHNDVRARSGR